MEKSAAGIKRTPGALVDLKLSVTFIIFNSFSHTKEFTAFTQKFQQSRGGQVSHVKDQSSAHKDYLIRAFVHALSPQ